MTTFSEADITRDADGKFASRTTSETRMSVLIPQRRSAKLARSLHASYDDADTFPTERFEHYMDAHLDDDQGRSNDRARGYASGYLGANPGTRRDGVELEAYQAGRADAHADRYYSPCQIGATSFHRDSLASSQRENERMAAASFHHRRGDVDFAAVEGDPEVTDARTRFETARDTYDSMPQPSPHDVEADDGTSQRAFDEAHEAFIRYESRRITAALRA